MQVNAFNADGQYMYFNHWTTDIYDLSIDNKNYGLSSLGCSTFKFSQVTDCSKLFITIDSTNKILNTLP